MIPEEVLFNNTNSQEQVGKSVYFDLEGYYFCSNHITRIATDTNMLLPRFLENILNLYQRNQVFYKLCTNWNNQSGIGIDVLKAVKIPVPEINKQKTIVNGIISFKTKAEQLRKEAATELETAKQEVEAMILGEAKA